mmetsp:Transcript_29349/g.70686  ORF Transcript_29349/g.70686 Transcript_29349/m.70686 type:complete len:406 (-) Transcript_29349:1238-2455(-)
MREFDIPSSFFWAFVMLISMRRIARTFSMASFSCSVGTRIGKLCTVCAVVKERSLAPWTDMLSQASSLMRFAIRSLTVLSRLILVCVANTRWSPSLMIESRSSLSRTISSLGILSISGAFSLCSNSASSVALSPLSCSLVAFLRAAFSAFCISRSDRSCVSANVRWISSSTCSPRRSTRVLATLPAGSADCAPFIAAISPAQSTCRAPPVPPANTATFWPDAWTATTAAPSSQTEKHLLFRHCDMPAPVRSTTSPSDPQLPTESPSTDAAKHPGTLSWSACSLTTCAAATPSSASPFWTSLHAPFDNTRVFLSPCTAQLTPAPLVASPLTAPCALTHATAVPFSSSPSLSSGLSWGTPLTSKSNLCCPAATTLVRAVHPRCVTPDSGSSVNPTTVHPPELSTWRK